jgi:hypothetical protein
VDLIGEEPGYGLGDYQLIAASSKRSHGADFDEVLSLLAQKRGTRKFNKKCDISPADMKAFLPNISILEPVWKSTGVLADARVTLHGSMVAAAYTDNTGRLVTEVHKPSVASRVLKSMQKAVDIEGPVIGTSEERDVQPNVRLNILYMPISNDGETISHFFSYVRLDKLD